MNNRLNESIDTYATLQGSTEPVGLRKHNIKTNDGWKEWNVTSTLEEIIHKQTQTYLGTHN